MIAKKLKNFIKKEQKQQNCCNSYKNYKNLEPILTECMISVREALDKLGELALWKNLFTDTKFIKGFIQKKVEFS